MLQDQFLKKKILETIHDLHVFIKSGTRPIELGSVHSPDQLQKMIGLRQTDHTQILSVRCYFYK